MPSAFIVLEGIDGTGKATQSCMLATWLFRHDKNINIVLTREPTGISPASRKLRKLLKSKESAEGEVFLKLFVEDRKFHVENLIAPALRAGAVVISERYKHSTFAYQMAQGVAFEKIKALHRRMPVPDLTIIIDMPAALALSRARRDIARKHIEVFEQERPFQEQIRQNYLRLPQLLKGEKIVIIDGRDSPKEVFGNVREEVGKIL